VKEKDQPLPHVAADGRIILRAALLVKKAGTNGGPYALHSPYLEQGSGRRFSLSAHTLGYDADEYPAIEIQEPNAEPGVFCCNPIHAFKHAAIASRNVRRSSSQEDIAHVYDHVWFLPPLDGKGNILWRPLAGVIVIQSPD
jgi:hypothetical protein